MYPLSVTNTNFKFRAGSNEYLDMSQDDIDDTDLYPTVEDSLAKAVNITNLRPAIQIKEILNSIIAQAGFSYTSSFLTSEYFSRIFMTTAGHVTWARPPIVGWGGENTNQCVVGGTEAEIITISWSVVGPLGSCTYTSDEDFIGYQWRTIKGDQVTPLNSDFDIPTDPLNLWSETGTTTYFTKTDQNMNSCTVSFVFNCFWIEPQ